MALQIVDAQQQQAQRDLRRRIARLRRRIDGRMRRVERQGRRAVSWRTYVRAYPGSAATAAFGLGLALSAGLSARSILRRLGMRLLGRATDRVGRECWREVERIWAESAPGKTADETKGADDE